MITLLNSRIDGIVNQTNRSSSFPENLSKIADSADERSISFGKYDTNQILEASKKLNQREQAAFGYLGHDASTAGIMRFAKAYISYVNSLSPEEQNGVRYRGTKENMSTLLAEAQTQLQKESGKPINEAAEHKSLLSMLFDEMKNQLQQQGITQKRHSSDFKTNDVVTISNAGRTLLSSNI
jgi:hypothetical protein